MNKLFSNDEYLSKLLSKTINLSSLNQNNAAGSTSQSKQHSKSLRMVFDVDSALQRVYGEPYNNWTCGGQWQNMFYHISYLLQVALKSRLHLIFYFNGALETAKQREWFKTRLHQNLTNKRTLNSIQKKGYSVNSNWQEPLCLQTCLFSVLLYLKAEIRVSTIDHITEILKFCRNNNIDGLLSEHPAFVTCISPISFFSSSYRITKGEIETEEYVIDTLLEDLKIDRRTLLVIGVLLGMH